MTKDVVRKAFENHFQEKPHDELLIQLVGVNILIAAGTCALFIIINFIIQ